MEGGASVKDNFKINSLGLDLGGSSIKCVLVRADGEILEKENLPFDSSSEMHWARQILSLVEKYRAITEFKIGISAPGLAAHDGKSIAVMPGRLKGLEGLNWTKYLTSRNEIPVLNDAHAALLGEVWLGAAQKYQNAILLTLGTGVGGAIYLDGDIFKGRNGRAGHFGHVSLDPHGPMDITGTPGALELAIGNCTIQERTMGRFETTHQLVEAVRSGDGFAQAIWLESVRRLGAAIISFVNILDVEAAIIGGGIARCGPELFEPLQQFVDAWEWRPGGVKVAIVPAQLGEFAGAIGAAYNALRQGE
jgi:glucokinase